MAPRTRRSQTMQATVDTPHTESDGSVLLERSTLVNNNTGTRSRVAARRVVPETQAHVQPQGTSNYDCTKSDFRTCTISNRETHLHTSSALK